MPLEILNTASYTGPVHVWHTAHHKHPSVGISSGIFSACLQPHEARALADALIAEADAATAKPERLAEVG